MFILLNIFHNPEVVISRHKTREAAEKANEKLQKIVKEKNGPNSYIPTKIVEGEK